MPMAPNGGGRDAKLGLQDTHAADAPHPIVQVVFSAKALQEQKKANRQIADADGPPTLNFAATRARKQWEKKFQQVLNPTPATCHNRKTEVALQFLEAALQKLHCNIRFSAVRKSFVPTAALQQSKN